MTKKSSTTLRAWIIWLLSAFFMFYKYALEVSPSVMNKTLMQTFHIGGVDLGNLAACYFYAYLILQIPAGLLLDKFGPRKVTTLAIILCALGTLLFAMAPSFGIACLGRFLTGIGAAFAVVNCMKLIANWFPPRQFAFMTGLMMTMAMLGAVGGQAPLASFIETYDFHQAMRMIGFVGLGLGILFWIIVKDKAPDHKVDKQLTSTKTPLLKSLKNILKSSQAWWLSIYSGFAFAPVMIFGGLWGVSFLSSAFHLSHNISAQSISLIFIGFAIGAPVFGLFSDWLGRRRIVMFWGTLLSLVCITLIVYAPGLSVSLLMFLLFLLGFSISSFLLCFTMIRENFPPILAATTVGFMNAFDAFFGAFSDPLTGKFLDLGWDGTLIEGVRIFSIHNYKMAFLTLPIYLLLSLISIIKIKETHCKPYNPSGLP